MTNQTIPPCPVCGTVPKIDKRDNRFLLVKCCGDKKPTEWLYTQWDDHCIEELGAALQLAGITTIAQLNARLAPDPRVAVLETLRDAVWNWGENRSDNNSLQIALGECDLAMIKIRNAACDSQLTAGQYGDVVQSSEPHPDGCFSADPNDVQDCDTDGHCSCKYCKRNSLIAAQRGEVVK